MFAEYKNKNDTSKRKNQIIILDLSLIPFELLETITGLIGRLILEFAQRINKVEDYKEERGNYPISLILEEAQNYIPEVDKNNKKSITKKVFERIAREGRKFGVSLIVSSQYYLSVILLLYINYKIQKTKIYKTDCIICK